MNGSYLDKIEGFIEQKVGKTMYLSEWCREINEEVMTRGRGLSNRELAFIFNRFMKSKFTISYTNSPIQYTFVEKVI